MSFGQHEPGMLPRKRSRWWWLGPLASSVIFVASQARDAASKDSAAAPPQVWGMDVAAGNAGSFASVLWGLAGLLVLSLLALAALVWKFVLGKKPVRTVPTAIAGEAA